MPQLARNLALLTISLAGVQACECDANQELDMSADRQAASRRRQESVAPEEQSEALFLDIIHRFYPRWDRSRESLEQYYKREPGATESEARYYTRR